MASSPDAHMNKPVSTGYSMAPFSNSEPASCPFT